MVYLDYSQVKSQMCCLSKFKKVSERNTNDVDRSPSSKSAKDERDLIIIVMIR